ncbi:MAG: TIM barrel protein [Planctomycetota bacterium]|nr:TIM barrel protein [Planctomycetota bacterium]
MKRRSFVNQSVVGIALATGLASWSPTGAAAPAPTPARKGRLRQSVCRWCFGSWPLERLCSVASELGLGSVELLAPDEWAVASKHGLTCAVASPMASNPIHKGWNRAENHEAMLRELDERLALCVSAGVPKQIVFSGNRSGLSDAEGLRVCAAGLREAVKLAEKHGSSLVMELLNSKVDHGDYQCDRTAWGADLVQAVGSDRFSLLYDIYHMQIMEGDVIRTIRTHHQAVGHYHTAGNPGRNEIDDTQELNYKAICEAIVETGFKGFLGQEFIPRRDPLQSLTEAVAICDV